MRGSNSKWVHPQETLLQGHILYNVKFLGDCEVDQPKGTDVVKEAIRKSKFNKQIKRAEGVKPPKVELLISADGVRVQDAKTKMIMYQYPLHRISYCADDKQDKRMLSFIAKAEETNRHNCYVFASDKCAEEITLTIGQAFDLAYKRFMETSSKDMDIKKQFLLLQRRVQVLQQENDILKKRIVELEKIKSQPQIEQYKKDNQIEDLTKATISLYNSGESDDSLTATSALPLSPVSEQATAVGRHVESPFQNNFTNGTKHSVVTTPILSPPPPSTKNRNTNSPSSNPKVDSNQQNVTANPFEMGEVDQFGMGEFNPGSPLALDRAILNYDRELMDIQSGFSQGLSIGTDNFTMEDFDPLNKKS